MSTTRPDHVLAARRALRPLVESADLLHTMAFSSLLPLAGMRGRIPVPWVHTDHWSGLTTPESLPKAWRVALPGLLPLLRGPDVATAVVERLAGPMRHARGDRPTLVVPCVVPAPPNGPPPRKEPDGTIDLVDVGGLVEGKDPLLAVDVVVELQRRGHPTRLRLVGDGPLADAVRTRAAQHGVAEQVTLVGTLDRPGVLAELARADLFLGPTRSDNFYVSAAEAVVSGRPVVAGANGGHAEYLDPTVSRLVPVQDAATYATDILDLLAATQDLTAGDIATTLGDRFEPDRVAQAYQQAYDLAAQLHGERRTL
ncbi:glycosyltransferase [Ornithinimicrobium sufpigmenti]|uniref:glycosyltransferase n=1 Tax=Ornithinimicrobium sufpigmenti TaxID=2508882 RepID=UPI0015E199E3|nr:MULTISPECIES: glycosyltransferase [unclassified Ornithinimicrobium]